MSQFTGLAVQGDYLVVSLPGSMRMFYTPNGESGAWTTADVAVNASHFADHEDALYFVGASGPIGDTTFGVFRYAPRANTARGTYASGDPATVRAVSRTLGMADNHTKVPWHRAGARISVAGTSPEGSVTLITGSYTHPGQEGPMESKALTGIDEVYAQAPGPSTEAHVQVDVEGDARIEAATVYWFGGASVR